MIEIRLEEPNDVAAIREVHDCAFGQEHEGRIVDALRANGGALLSLVAVHEADVVGHIMYSPLRLGSLVGAALGPMAVAPDHQRRGIGTRLVESGNGQLARAGCPCIAVVGHPAFYPRFGFRPAKTYGITCEWAVPDEAFMVVVLDPAKMSGVTGTARYRLEFSTVS